MKRFFLLALLPLQTFAQNLHLDQPEQWPGWRERTIYMFCRGTRSKTGSIGRRFNQTDTNSTHAGIGFFDRGRVHIYHVTDEPGGNALRIDSSDAFFSRADMYYFSIWEMVVTTEEFKRFRWALDSFGRRNIAFDISFRLRDDDSLYCSEFCAAVLKKSLKHFPFAPVRRQLTNKLYAAFLNRTEIWYYPVDFFQSAGFRKLWEWKE